MTVLIHHDLLNSAETEAQRRVERFAQVFTRVNSVLTLRPVKVRTEHSYRTAPAWSTADTVTFNSRLIGDLREPKDIAMIRGLDLHEVAHILYTPRTGSDIWQWVQECGMFQTFNLLEDQRIETLLVGRYPSIVPWLTATIAKFLIETEHFDQSYPLLRGRRYLPVEVRRAARKAYVDQDRVEKIAKVIDEYRMLIFPRDTDRAKDLIIEMDELLTHHAEDGSVKVEPDRPNPHGHGDRPQEGLPSSGSRPATEREQEADRKKAEQLDGDPTEDDDLGEDAQGADGDESDDAGDSEGGLGMDDTDSGSQGSTDPSTGSTEGLGAGESGAPNPKAALDALLNDLIEDVLESNADMIEDIARQIAGLPSLSSNSSTAPEPMQCSQVAPLPMTLDAARSFGRELERIRTSHDPSWLRRVDSGRLDSYRASRGDDLDTVYDRFQRGREDATDIECVVILDISGSMGGSKGDSAYQAMYAVKRALDKVEASTTVLTFGSYSKTLYDSRDKADLMVRHGGIGGGTQPLHAVKYATKILAETTKAVRIFIAITDGDWYDADASDEAIRKMRTAGVLTSLAYIPDFGTGMPKNRHNCETVTVIKNVPDIVGVAREIVRLGIARQLLNS